MWGCAVKKSAPTIAVKSVEAFDAMLLRTELQTCDDITSHGSTAPPDCRRIYEAWDRGRERVSIVYPEALTLTMGSVWFYQPPTQPSPSGKPYPVFVDQDIRGRTITDGFLQINYSYEEVVEHETVHALVFILDGLKRRTESARQASAIDQRTQEFLWEIACHGTPDDPFGVLGNIASCIEDKH